jgi:hypothetical protein
MTALPSEADYFTDRQKRLFLTQSGQYLNNSQQHYWGAFSFAKSPTLSLVTVLFEYLSIAMSFVESRFRTS